jgi:uncharacterized protein involved in exopolysaccharide biosynthesis
MESLEVLRYISYLRSRWRFVAVSCATAVALAGIVSLLLPRQYTARARVLIDPPAGVDPRAALAVSPIYLESLKTYEHFAESDSLFQKAADRFELRQLLGSKPIEKLKRSTLDVATVRNTRILEISATLPDPVRAQALAQFIAEQAVAMNRTLTSTSGQDLARTLEEQERDAQNKLQQVDAEMARSASSEPTDSLQSSIERAGELRANLEQEAANTKLEMASGSELGAHSKARLSEIQKQIDDLDRQTAQQEKLLTGRLVRRDKLDADRKSASAALASVEKNLRDARNEIAYRGERLTVIDPGVVPEQPSSPNLSLNLAAALLLGLLFPVVYLAFEMSFQEQRVLDALARHG